jgi:hypothetical protein
VRELRGGRVGTLAGTGEPTARDGPAAGGGSVGAGGVGAAIGSPTALFLDELRGALYVATGAPRHCVRAIGVPSRAQRRASRLFLLVRLWALVQRQRAVMVDDQQQQPLLCAAAIDDEKRARGALRLLMQCPIADVLTRSLMFAFN